MTTKTELAYKAYRAYALVSEPTIISYDEFQADSTLVTTWEGVADVFSHYGTENTGQAQAA